MILHDTHTYVSCIFFMGRWTWSVKLLALQRGQPPTSYWIRTLFEWQSQFFANLFMYMLHHLPDNFMWFSLIFICQRMFGIFVGVIMPMMLLDLFCLHVLQVFVDRIPISFLGQGLGMAAVGTPRNRSFNGSNSKEKAARARWQPVAQIESKVGASLGAGMGWPVVWRNT